jgi:hypothetical protein
LGISRQGELKNTIQILLQKVQVENFKDFDVRFSSTFLVLSRFRVCLSDGSSKILQKTFSSVFFFDPLPPTTAGAGGRLLFFLAPCTHCPFPEHHIISSEELVLAQRCLFGREQGPDDKPSARHRVDQPRNRISDAVAVAGQLGQGRAGAPPKTASGPEAVYIQLSLLLD